MNAAYSALVVTALVVAGLLAWALLAAAVGVVVGRIAKARDRQVPRHDHDHRG